MTDLLKRLTEVTTGNEWVTIEETHKLLGKAANEIARLTAEIQRLEHELAKERCEEEDERWPFT